MVRCAVNCWSVRGRASVETKSDSRSFVTKVIVSALGAESSIFVNSLCRFGKVVSLPAPAVSGSDSQGQSESWNGSVLQDVKNTTFDHSSLCTFGYVLF